ncbi:hypothetical protein V3595_26700 [Bacillus sp. CFBP9009]
MPKIKNLYDLLFRRPFNWHLQNQNGARYSKHYEGVETSVKYGYKCSTKKCGMRFKNDKALFTKNSIGLESLPNRKQKYEGI